MSLSKNTLTVEELEARLRDERSKVEQARHWIEALTHELKTHFTTIIFSIDAMDRKSPYAEKARGALDSITDVLHRVGTAACASARRQCAGRSPRGGRGFGIAAAPACPGAADAARGKKIGASKRLTRLPTKRLATACWATIVAKRTSRKAAPMLAIRALLRSDTGISSTACPQLAAPRSASHPGLRTRNPRC